jgi:hypothetical protein
VISSIFESVDSKIGQFKAIELELTLNGCSFVSDYGLLCDHNVNITKGRSLRKVGLRNVSGEYEIFVVW